MVRNCKITNLFSILKIYFDLYFRHYTTCGNNDEYMLGGRLGVCLLQVGQGMT